MYAYFVILFSIHKQYVATNQSMTAKWLYIIEICCEKMQVIIILKK